METKYKKLYVLPATINLAGLDIELVEKSRQETGFQKGEQLKNNLAEYIKQEENKRSKYQTTLNGQKMRSA